MIYLDHSATTPLDRQVLDEMRPYFEKKYGNPSSKHQLGEEAEKAIEKSRQRVADFFNTKKDNVTFTAGGSQANNLALRGLTTKIAKDNSSANNKDEKKPHLITSQIEHSSVLNTAKLIEENGQWVVSYLEPSKNGLITAESLRSEIKDSTRVVSLMLANNETGAIQPISQIGKLIEEINKKRDSKDRIYFHTDAVQAIEYLDCRLDHLKTGMLSLSAHKFYGPKGAGALITQDNTPLSPLISGGSQEQGLIAGTENVPALVGLGKAIESINGKRKKISKQAKKLRNYFENQLQKKIKDIEINSKSVSRLPGSSNVLFLNAEGEAILLSLDMAGIAVSTGSACASKNLKPSRVLLAMGVPPEKAQSAIRFSFGKGNNKKQVDKTVRELKKIVLKLRRISPEE